MVINAGDLATFIYDGTRYNLIGVDRSSIEFHKSDITIINSIASCMVSYYVHGNLNGTQLFFSLELCFKPTSDITISSSDSFIVFKGLSLLSKTNNFTWQDIQGYFEYTNLTPMVIGNYGGNANDFILRFRATQNFVANKQRTLRINFTTLAEKR